MPRPNRVITSMKKRDYENTIWEMLLYEYRMAKNGDTEHRLGPNALTSLVTALKDLQAHKIQEERESKGKPNLIELEEWVQSEKEKKSS